MDTFIVVMSAKYCGGPAHSPWEWIGSGATAAELSDAWPQLHGRTVVGTFRGRSAIALACQVLGIKGGDEVLMPAYCCGTEIDAILHSGARVVGYRISAQAEIDLYDLKAKQTAATRAVYVTHYFGWEQHLAEIRKWCDDDGLFLIEDCALSLFSEGPSGRLGHVGDAAIFSLAKTLGFKFGGLLSLDRKYKNQIPPQSPSDFSAWQSEFFHSVRTTLLRGLDHLGLYGPLKTRRWGAAQATPDAGVPEMPQGYYFSDVRDENRPLPNRSLAIARAIRWENLVDRRRQNYCHLYDALRSIRGIRPLFPELPSRVCPLSLPLLVSNRDHWVDGLLALGIPATPWWKGYHRMTAAWAEFPEASMLKERILTLPVHHGLNQSHMQHIQKCVSEIAPTIAS